MRFTRTQDGGIIAVEPTDRWDPEIDDYVEETIFVLTAEQADAFVVAHLRGPSGPPGPTGPMGMRGPAADEGRP